MVLNNTSGGFVSFWPIESQVYPQLDAMRMRGETRWRETFQLGDGHRVSMAIASKTGSVLSLHQPFRTCDIDVSFYFLSGTGAWFGIDNQGDHGYLHSHIASGTQAFQQRTPLPETCTLSGLVSQVFHEAEAIMRWKYPQATITSGASFTGCK